ncbi:MAG TPA: hypothetical protein VIX73_05545 [Kofleriaceae bacterium]|jgi:Flp pilus assembly protein TadB
MHRVEHSVAREHRSEQLRREERSPGYRQSKLTSRRRTSSELHSGMAGDREAELEGWIENTRRLQRRLAWIYGAAGGAALALTVWNGRIGGFVLFAVALVAICSFWVTAAHNAAHRQKLAELHRVADNGGKPLETAHRRWHT